MTDFLGLAGMSGDNRLAPQDSKLRSHHSGDCGCAGDIPVNAPKVRVGNPLSSAAQT
jgi:hypothetical protein